VSTSPVETVGTGTSVALATVTSVAVGTGTSVAVGTVTGVAVGSGTTSEKRFGIPLS
jgi:hypothetical protein